MTMIVLALDACTRLEQLLPAALLLASQQHAELLGMFAQDARLLQGAALPFTHEVGSNTGVCYPLTGSSMAQRLQSTAEQMRWKLAKAAERQHLPWKFQICRGSIAQITSEMIADMVLPGWSANWSVSESQAGAWTRKISNESVIVVVDDGSPASAHVLAQARDLSDPAGRHSLVILITSPSAGTSPARQPAVAGDKPAKTERVIVVDSLDQLIQRIRMLHPTVFLLGRDQDLATSSRLQKELTLMKCPVALIRSSQ